MIPSAGVDLAWRTKAGRHLVALMWLGRGDGEAEEFEQLVTQALKRREVHTEDYLLDHPWSQSYWLEGMERLGLGGLVGD
jgi:hypothetical protein